MDRRYAGGNIQGAFLITITGVAAAIVGDLTVVARTKGGGGGTETGTGKIGIEGRFPLTIAKVLTGGGDNVGSGPIASC